MQLFSESLAALLKFCWNYLLSDSPHQKSFVTLSTEQTFFPNVVRVKFSVQTSKQMRIIYSRVYRCHSLSLSLSLSLLHSYTLCVPRNKKIAA